MKNRLNDGGVSLIHSSVLLSDRKDDMRQKAAEYFEEKRIMPLLQKLTALLVHEKPENPRQFLIEKLKQMKEAKISPEDFSSSLMTDEDLAVVFKTMDVNDRGEISTSQCKQGLLSLGVPEGEISLDMQDKTKMYSVEEFKKMAASGLKTI
uniref:EF-hand domain-containing protein n=2 Tax=Lotharella globosa TaxID=91324 RepID=A0A7S4DIM1_9EUKA|mmetsp:Transcript_6484/g.12842  ORF Transcript_6484/g.12842 Transcript_6484/m.12842 type:complete len:151 (+) Transcript_6484:680-1132(+)